MHDQNNDPNVPPVDIPTGYVPGQSRSHEAPPIQGLSDATSYPRPGQTSPPTQPWTWIAFAAIIIGLMGLQLFAYFNPEAAEGPSKPEIATEIASNFRLLTAIESLSGQAGLDPKTSQEGWKSAEDAIKEDGIEDTAEARYVVVAQKLQAKDPDPKALETLRNSKDPTDQAVARAVTGDAKAADRLKADSDDLAERLAHAIARESGGETNVRSNLMAPGELAMTLIGPMLLIALLGSGTIILIGWFVYQGTGGIGPAVGFPTRPVSLYAADMSALRAALFLGAYFFIAQGVVAAVLAIYLKVDMGVSMLVGQFVGLAILLGIAAINFRDGTLPLGKMIRGQGSLPKLFGAGILGYMANFPAFMLLTVIAGALLQNLPTPSHAVAEQLANATPLTYLLLFLVAAVFAPILEEIVFRGWLFQGLTTRTGKVALSIFISGITFAVIHPQGPILYPALAWIGAMGAFLTYRTASLVPAMVMHALHNATVLLIGTSLLG